MRTEFAGEFSEAPCEIDESQAGRLLKVYQYSPQSQAQRPDLYPVDEASKPQVFRMEYKHPQTSTDRYQPVIMGVWTVGPDKVVSFISEKVLQQNPTT